VGWKYGFKLHLIINERGELLAFKPIAANTDDRKPVPEMTQGLTQQPFQRERLYCFLDRQLTRLGKLQRENISIDLLSWCICLPDRDLR
jgi:hypothetical protein